MSFDLDTLYNRMEIRVSIPFDQGNVFRQNVTFYPSYFFLCLNPFRSGQCLSTHKNLNLFSVRGSQSLSIRAMSFDGCIMSNSTNLQGLNPFRSGQCLSTSYCLPSCERTTASQSLSIRAMSFDCSGMLEAGIMRPFRPTSQFFWKAKELALDLSK